MPTTPRSLRRPRRPRRPRRRRRILAALLAVAAAAFLVQPEFAEAAPSHNPIGYLDTMVYQNGHIAAGGWALDPDAVQPLRIDFLVDGTRRTSVVAGNYRADIARVFPTMGGYHGYSAVFQVPDGVHSICASAVNVGAGVNSVLGCRTFTINNNPFGYLDSVILTTAGVRVTGWAIDPNTGASIPIQLAVDGVVRGTVTANGSRPDVGRVYPAYGSLHGFTAVLAVADGTHRICANGVNLGFGTANTSLGCNNVASTRSPIGAVNPLARADAAGTVALSGWAIDPDTVAAIGVRVLLDGVEKAALTANVASTWVGQRYPQYGAAHAFYTSVAADTREHRICVVGKNAGSGADTTLGCQVATSTGATTPSAPGNVAAWPGNGSVDVTWSASTATTSPATAYTIAVSPGRTVTVGPSATRATIGGLVNGATYGFTISATNALGTGSSVTVTSSPSNIPPQFSPAPVSTSHYIRNINGNLAHDAVLLRQMGATDATYNPSGHRYLVLLQIGGQDESRGGVLLSATSTFVSYPAVVNAMKAYLDGYKSRQKPYAPLTLAIGTNNDVDVSRNAGISWARNVVNPVVGYAARYPGVSVGGANDIEPGFSATVAESRAWVGGYLAASTAEYVFNGSADGCSFRMPGQRCNNGWTMADLQWLAGGAAPSRSMSVPQIYNYDMPLQWKYISLTGTNARLAKLYFGGPLTEWTACAQAGSCGSITNVDAWGRLWSAISSTPATRQYDMPHGTDLRIN